MADEEAVDAIMAVEPYIPLQTNAARKYASYLKVWFIGADEDFDEEAWQAQISDLAAIETEAAAAQLNVERVIRDRLADLASCNKDDDCHTKAEGIELALDDVAQARVSA